MSYFLSNISAKNSENRFMYVKVRAAQSSDDFEAHCRDFWTRIIGAWKV